MKEWAPQSYPGQGAHVPTQGIAGMGEAARALGSGLESGLDGLAYMQQRVASAGMASRFENLCNETLANNPAEPPETARETLLRESDSAAAEYISGLPHAMQEPARQELKAAQQRVLVQAERQNQLARVDEARRDWQQQLERAVSSADEPAALRQLERGREVFVPEGQMEMQRRAVSSRCCAARWQQRLDAAPLETLAAWRGKQETPPEDAETRGSVQNAMAAAGLQLKQQLSRDWSEQLRNGQSPDRGEVKRAVAAGLLPQPQESPVVAEWQRRADALGDDAEEVADWRMQVASLPLPAATRRELLSYQERGAALPGEARREVGAALDNLYRSGRFGCVGDRVPQSRMARLQREAQQLLTTRKPEEVRGWLRDLSADDTAWVCFEPLS